MRLIINRLFANLNTPSSLFPSPPPPHLPVLTDIRLGEVTLYKPASFGSHAGKAAIDVCYKYRYVNNGTITIRTPAGRSMIHHRDDNCLMTTDEDTKATSVYSTTRRTMSADWRSTHSSFCYGHSSTSNDGS